MIIPKYKPKFEVGYAWHMPNHQTFLIKPIENVLAHFVTDPLDWVDPFAGDNSPAGHTNDINPNKNAIRHLESLEFLNLFQQNSMGGVLFDPPYSPRQLKECYDGLGHSLTSRDTSAAWWSERKSAAANILRKGGLAISFGWSTGGLGKKNGFEKVYVLFVAHGGMHNDTIMVVERKLDD